MILPEEVELFEPMGPLVGSQIDGLAFEFFEGMGIGFGASTVNTSDFLELVTRTVTFADSPVTVTPDDYEILVNATDGPVVLLLPDVTSLKKYRYRFKKIEFTPNVVNIQAFAGNLIDDSDSVTLSTQWGECELFNAAPSYWDNMGSGSIVDLGAVGSPVTIEVPTGDIDGVNIDFSTVNSFISITVYLNGQRLRGGGNDYTVSGVNAFTMTSAPLTGDYLEVEYVTSDAIPEPPSEGVRYVTDPGPPISVSLQIKNSGDVWETIWTESASI